MRRVIKESENIDRRRTGGGRDIIITSKWKTYTDTITSTIFFFLLLPHHTLFFPSMYIYMYITNNNNGHYLRVLEERICVVIFIQMD